MFALVQRCPKKGLKFYIKEETLSVEGVEFLKISLPFPKSKRQKRLLTQYLSPFEGQVIFDNFFGEKEEFSKYKINTENFEKKLLIAAFLDYCKKNKPKSAMITGKKFLNNRFFAELGKYTDKIYIPFDPFDRSLSLNILKNSGAPVIFGYAEESECACLCLENSVPNLNVSVIFEKKFFQKLKYKEKQILNKDFSDFDALELSAAIDKTDCSNIIFNKWKMLVIENNMIYNIK